MTVEKTRNDGGEQRKLFLLPASSLQFLPRRHPLCPPVLQSNAGFGHRSGTQVKKLASTKGFLLVGILFTTMAKQIGAYASVLSMQVSGRAIRNRMLVLHARLGAESAIEAAIRKLNDSSALETYGTGGTQNDCDGTAAAVNDAPVLSAGTYLVEAISDSSTITDVYKVNWGVNMDLSASLLLSQSQWVADAANRSNAGYPDHGVGSNVYSTSANATGYMAKCLTRTSQRLLRAEANVVKVGYETAQPAITRRVAAIVVIDPLCSEPGSGVPPFPGCQVEVVHWYEE